jgi:hypothetical protein
MKTVETYLIVIAKIFDVAKERHHDLWEKILTNREAL